MDPVTSAPAAPAPPAAAHVSATFDAASKGDFSAFQEASSSARAGKPLADVTATPVDPNAPAAPAQPQLSRKEREQHETNERIRKAVETATADLRSEITTLRTAPRSAPPPAAPVQPEAPKEPAYKRYLALPDAPKLANFDSVEEHAAAMAFFIHEKTSEERATADSQRQDHERLTQAQGERVEKFIKQLDASKAADPEFVNKLTPDVRALKPFGALQPGEASGPRNVIAEQIYDSPIAPKVLLHFSEHPDELTALETMPPQIAAIADPQKRAREHIKHMVTAFNRLEGRLEGTSPSPAASLPAPSTITAAPPPLPSVSSRAGASADPATAAVAKGDFAAFQRTEDAKRREKLGR